MNSESPTRGAIVVDVLSGAGLGLLLGLIVALSVSPVVGVVVGGLMSVLAVFLGLQGGDDAKVGVLSKVQLNGVRIGSFGLAASLGVLLGLYVRINNPMAEAPEHQMARWLKAFPDNPVLARQLMVAERTAYTSAALKFDKDAPAVAVAAASGAGAKQPFLFSSADMSGRNLCKEFQSAKFGEDPEKNLQNNLLAIEDLGTPFAKAVSQVRGLPKEQQGSAVAMANAMLCAMHEAQQDDQQKEIKK